jgi:hypothetical protein
MPGGSHISQFGLGRFIFSDSWQCCDMPKTKRKSKNQPRKEKRDFAPNAFSIFQKGTGVKVNAQRHSRSGRGK